MAQKQQKYRQLLQNLRGPEEARYRTLFEQSPVGIFVFDAAGRITECNETLARQLNSSPGRIVGLNLRELRDKRVLPYVEEALRGKPAQYEGPYRATSSDAHIWAHIRISPLQDETGKVTGGIATVEDFTARKQTEEALQESERKQKELTNYHRILSEASISLAEAGSEDGVIETIAGSFRNLSGALAAAVSIYDPKSRELFLKFLAIDAPKRKQLEAIFGKDLFSMRWTISEQLKDDMIKQIVNRPASLEELTWGAIPAHQSSRVMEQFGIEEIIALTIRYGNELLGTAVAILDKKQPHLVDKILETFARMAGLAITRTQAEQKLHKSEERYRLLVENANEAIVVAQDGRHKYVNPAAVQFFGYSQSELTRTPFINFIHPEDRAIVAEQYRKRIAGEAPRGRYSFRITAGDGSVKWAEISAVMIEWEGRPAALNLISDITERKHYEEQLKYMSLHDQLTGLYNRAFFEEEMSRLSASREFPVTIIVADIDGLKLINDTMGHARGDQLLKACAQVLRRSLRESDILARIGGDEFAVLLPRTDYKTGEEVAGRIRSQAALHNRERPELPLSISIGTATAESSAVSLETVFKKADDIMYRQKLSRRSSIGSNIIDTLVAVLDERDYMAGGHAQRLSELCLAAGEKLELPSSCLDKLALLSRVHDLGKVVIPDEILFKKAPLSAEEWEVMRQHPEKGYNIAIYSPDLSTVAELILKHHERWDGSGYPLGLKEEEIPLECRIFAIADAYDAMTSERPYREAMSREEAVAELKKGAGTQFDPDLVAVFLAILG